VFAGALSEIARQDPKVVAITAAMLEGTSLTKFQKEFPERTFDVGIAEAHAVISAAGMACDGLRPFACIYSTFLQRAFDPIMHDVAIQNLPVVFSLDRAGLVGADGPTHHGVFDFAYMRTIPNMVVMAPKDASELRHMTATAHQYTDGPIVIRFPRGKAAADQDLTEPLRALEIGKGEILREGRDVCLIGIGIMTKSAIAAADLLAKEGINVGVANARFIKPLDCDLMRDLCSKYATLITIEDHARMGGFGSAVNEALADMEISMHATVLGIPDHFISHGTQASLYDQCGLSPEAIAETVREKLEAKREAPTEANGKTAELGKPSEPGDAQHSAPEKATA